MNILQGKKCLITGASSGLGLELTKLFIQKGAQVIMLCRNELKCEDLMQRLLTEYPNSVLHYEIADFTSLESVERFLMRFKEKHTSLDILINNAAVLKSRITNTVDGFESMFQVNYLIPFVLTNSLLGLIGNSNAPQIINIALPPEKLRLDFSDLQSIYSFKPMEAMFRTKLCLFLFSLELANRLSDTNINVRTGIPSQRPFKTNLGREMPYVMKLTMSLISTDADKVARNILHIAQDQSISSGHVFKALKQVSLNPYWQNSDIRNRLWLDTEKLITKEFDVVD